MFAGCKNIISIDLENFKSEKIENMEYMFYNCNNLENINLLSFKTENVNNMSYMFLGCNNIKNLDLSSFIIKNNTNINSIFKNSEDLEYFNFYSINERNRFTINYNITFVGESEVGVKTSLISRIVHNKFYPGSSERTGFSYSFKSFELYESKRINIILFDNYGQYLILKNSDCFVLGSDITRKSTFHEVKEYWYPSVKKYRKPI